MQSEEIAEKELNENFPKELLEIAKSKEYFGGEFIFDKLGFMEKEKVEIIPFDEITEEHAKIEGEGDGSLAYWQEGHLKFFKEDAKALNFEFRENDLVVFMTFKVIHQ